MAKIKVYNLIILDESGSMDYIKQPTIRGFNELAQTIKGAEKENLNQEHYISLVTFNALSIRTKLDKAKAIELNELNEDTFHPNAGTPLYDAIGQSIVNLRNSIRTQENLQVLVTILTDGEENSSREYTWKQIRQMIEDQKRKGWTFTYIGANHDVEKAATQLSIVNHMKFESREEDVHAMFEKEKKARKIYYQKIGREDLASRFYDEDDLAEKKQTTKNTSGERSNTTTPPKSEGFLNKLARRITQ